MAMEMWKNKESRLISGFKVNNYIPATDITERPCSKKRLSCPYFIHRTGAGTINPGTA